MVMNIPNLELQALEHLIKTYCSSGPDKRAAGEKLFKNYSQSWELRQNSSCDLTAHVWVSTARLNTYGPNVVANYHQGKQLPNLRDNYQAQRDKTANHLKYVFSVQGQIFLILHFHANQI